MKRLETSRTWLRPLEEPQDLIHLRRLMTDPDIMRLTGFKTPQSEQVIQERLTRWAATASTALGVLAVFEKGSDEFVGWYMLVLKDSEDPEIGFMLVKEKWGQGFGSEVALEVLRHGFEDLKYPKIVAYASPENGASIALLEKIGMAQLPDPRAPDGLLYFEILKEEFSGELSNV